ncbi:isopentenyl diphosphate isomerase/L-lactate dehydrogenase-like FMN-dependent dehydrogenase [Paenibacillus harenae]|uniref:Isopentenyl diphosphate isomerase/L-lactate dehydrogenase-like FMN-dependent dehydrogenase n=1 Tax=Paenibacillus harenae TaxID=306543 RepID=A0ABT9UE51_PAEHA|nr:isopentenyl diphosphate isomerase/L-lactate dehydrogenase-like FMN-dependent dehydrogenase [Paenibacillus harenae]
MTVSIPIMIAAMSFGGALSKKTKIALASSATGVGTATKRVYLKRNGKQHSYSSVNIIEAAG